MNNVLTIIVWIILTNQIIISQNWLPIEMGNRWQFLHEKWSGLSIPNGTVTYDLKEIIITKDTIINQVRYFFRDAELIRYSIEDNKAYTWWNAEERVYMDFNKTVGDTFHNGSAVYTITEGSKIIFLDTLEFKGFRRTYVTQPNNTSHTVEARFLPDIGWYSFHSSSFSAYYFNIQTDELLMGILRDSIGSFHYLTGHYKPQINLTPITTINKQLFKLELNIDHQYNIYPNQNSSGFIFIDSIILESYYSRFDSIIVNPIKVPQILPNSNYEFRVLLDTTRMKNSFSFSYRIRVKDKGIIPETAISPDTGYYQCVWDFSTDVENDDEFTIKEFSLSQNYPNPFNPSTEISWQLPVGSWQTLKVFDVLGKEVATLVNEFRIAGSYEVEFNATHLPSGIYFYQLKAGEFVETKKMLLLK